MTILLLFSIALLIFSAGVIYNLLKEVVDCREALRKLTSYCPEENGHPGECHVHGCKEARILLKKL